MYMYHICALIHHYHTDQVVFVAVEWAPLLFNVQEAETGCGNHYCRALNLVIPTQEVYTVLLDFFAFVLQIN
jgi:hypothetical protein